MKRREFISGATAGLLVPAAVVARPSQIIDTHIHLYDPARPEGVPWPPKSDALLYKPVLPDAFQDMVRPLGVTGAIVVEASAWLEDNQWVLDLAKDHPVIVGVVGHLDPGSNEFRGHLARFAKDPLFRGIRLNGGAIAAGAAKPAFLDDLRRMADRDLMLDAIGNATMVRSLIAITERITTLRLAIDHMPQEPPGWQTSALRELAARPQVYAKVSGVLKRVDGRVPQNLDAYRADLDTVWEMFGQDRVMYGSNWPVSDRLAPYASVLRVVESYCESKGASAAQKFFWKNSQACYRWSNRAPA